MGRVRYTAEERRTVMHSFIEATWRILLEEGSAACSIREISRRSGYTSATLYLYFADIDELLMYVGVRPLTELCAALSSPDAQGLSPRRGYERFWRLSCRYAFQDPDLFYSLFFGAHRGEISDVVTRYYEVFPDELGTVADPALDLLLQGGIHARGMAALGPLAHEREMSDRDARLANSLAVDHFRCALLDLRGSGHSLEQASDLAEGFVRAAAFLAGRGA